MSRFRHDVPAHGDLRAASVMRRQARAAFVGCRPACRVLALLVPIVAAACDGDPSGPGTDEAYTAVSAGFSHTCAVRADGDLHCWGDDAAFQLGDDAQQPPCSGFAIPCATTPVTVSGSIEWQVVSTGTTFTCALATDGRAYCWGRNDQDQLGVTGPERACDVPPYGLRLDCREEPTAVGGALRFDAIAAGNEHACALDRDGRAYCWGSNGDGRLGTGTSAPSSQPTPVAGDHVFRMITVGNRHSCAITVADELYCWGSMADGQVGAGSGDALEPRAVLPALRFREVSAGGHHACAITANDTTYCWGNNSSGQLGDGTIMSPRAPFALDIDPLASVASGFEHTCGLARTGTLLCWGDNVFGQLGDGTAVRRLAPTAVALDVSVAHIDGGWGHTCAVTTGGRVWCWGINTLGQLARASTSELPQPTPQRIEE